MPAKIFTYLAGALAIILVIIAAAFAIGYKLGVASGWQGGWEKAAEKVSQSNPVFAEPAETKTVIGQIKAIERDYLSVETWPATLNPLIESQKLLRKVMIIQETKIWRQKMKTPAAMAAEIKDGLPPAPFILEPVKKDDLKIGDTVSITAVENIKDEKEFTASRIILINT